MQETQWWEMGWMDGYIYIWWRAHRKCWDRMECHRRVNWNVEVVKIAALTLPLLSLSGTTVEPGNLDHILCWCIWRHHQWLNFTRITLIVLSLQPLLLNFHTAYEAYQLNLTSLTISKWRCKRSCLNSSQSMIKKIKCFLDNGLAKLTVILQFNPRDLPWLCLVR